MYIHIFMIPGIAVGFLLLIVLVTGVVVLVIQRRRRFETYIILYI